MFLWEQSFYWLCGPPASAVSCLWPLGRRGRDLNQRCYYSGGAVPPASFHHIILLWPLPLLGLSSCIRAVNHIRAHTGTETQDERTRTHTPQTEWTAFVFLHPILSRRTLLSSLPPPSSSIPSAHHQPPSFKHILALNWIAKVTGAIIPE